MRSDVVPGVEGLPTFGAPHRGQPLTHLKRSPERENYL
jgi:hypothetical protein